MIEPNGVMKPGGQVPPNSQVSPNYTEEYGLKGNLRAEYGGRRFSVPSKVFDEQVDGIKNSIHKMDKYIKNNKDKLCLSEIDELKTHLKTKISLERTNINRQLFVASQVPKFLRTIAEKFARFTTSSERKDIKTAEKSLEMLENEEKLERSVQTLANPNVSKEDKVLAITFILNNSLEAMKLGRKEVTTQENATQAVTDLLSIILKNPALRESQSKAIFRESVLSKLVLDPGEKKAICTSFLAGMANAFQSCETKQQKEVLAQQLKDVFNAFSSDAGKQDDLLYSKLNRFIIENITNPSEKDLAAISTVSSAAISRDLRLCLEGLKAGNITRAGGLLKALMDSGNHIDKKDRMGVINAFQGEMLESLKSCSLEQAKGLKKSQDELFPKELQGKIQVLRIQIENDSLAKDLETPSFSVETKRTAINKMLKNSVEQIKLGDKEGVQLAENLLSILLKNSRRGDQTSPNPLAKSVGALTWEESDLVNVRQLFKSEVKRTFEDCKPEQVHGLAEQLREVLKDFKSNSQLYIDLDQVIGKETWEHFNDLKITVMNKTGNIPLEETPVFSFKAHSVEFNNYGLRPDPDSVVYRDGDAGATEDQKKQYVQSFKFGGGSITIPPDQEVVFDKEQNMLFNQKDAKSMLNCDQVSTKALESGACIMTLADGCALSKFAQTAAAEAVKLSMDDVKDKFAGVKDSHDVTLRQLNYVQDVQKSFLERDEKIEGDTTFVQAYIQAGVLCGVAIGDAKLFVMRKTDNGWQCIDLTKDPRAGREASDSGGRFSGQSNQAPQLDNVRAISFPLEKGDIVMVSSDGVADCFDPHELKDGSKNLEENMAALLTQNECTNSNEIQKCIENRLQSVTFEEKLLKLRGGVVPKEGKTGWGKMDNANMSFFTYLS